MQTNMNVITLSILAALMITGCSRDMKSRSVDLPRTQNELGSPDVNPHSGIPNDEPTPIEIPGAEPLSVEPEPVVTTPTTPPVVVKPPSTPTAPPTTNSLFAFFPLLWEKTVTAAKGWTQIIYSVIKKEESYLLGQNVADDVELFCPNYRKLNEEHRMNFWGQLFASLAFHESSWNPVSRMVEKNFIYNDSVTKMPVVSEGLLQLSYQDEESYRLDCGFDWSKDKHLSAKDPKKTILDPYNNLRCGIKIMSAQLKKHRSITLSSNVYWAVLKTNGRYSKIAQISAATRSLKICQK
jgi:hypothetical protein